MCNPSASLSCVAQDGDTVLVARGTYPGGLSIANKSITLASNFINTGDPNDINLTIIDGGSTMLNNQVSAGPSTTVRGFTFRNGGHQINVAARRANNTILNSGNDGIEMRLHVYSGSTLTTIIRNNFISGANQDGIQLIDYDSLTPRLVRIEGNVIVNNAMVGLGCMPDGMSNENFGGAPLQEEVQVVNNTFSGNLHGLTGGDKTIVMNNIFANSAQVGVKRVTGGRW